MPPGNHLQNDVATTLGKLSIGAISGVIKVDPSSSMVASTSVVTPGSKNKASSLKITTSSSNVTPPPPSLDEDTLLEIAKKRSREPSAHSAKVGVASRDDSAKMPQQLSLDSVLESLEGTKRFFDFPNITGQQLNYSRQDPDNISLNIRVPLLRGEYRTNSMPPSRLLAVDLRPSHIFSQSWRLKGSVCLNLPPLILKRLTKGVAVAIENFMATPDCQASYRDWTNSGEERVMVVFEDLPGETEDPEGENDALVILSALGKLFKSSKTLVCRVDRGLNSILRDPTLEHLVEMPVQVIPEAMISSPAMDSPSTVYTTEPPETPLRLNSLSISPMKTSLIKSPSLSIPGSEGNSPRKKSRAGFSINTSPLHGVSPSLRTFSAIETVNAASAGKPVSAHLGPGQIQTSNHSPSTPTMPLDVDDPGISEIRPYLMLGSDSIPTSENAGEQLKKLGVTHVVNMAKEVVVHETLVSEAHGIDYLELGVYDHPDEDVDGVLKRALEHIENVRASNSNAVILVHCHAGRSRSAMVVIGHLIAAEKMSLQNALADVRERRHGGVAPNVGFLLALMKIEKDVHGAKE